MQLPPEADDELELSGELPKPPRRRVERLVDEQRRLRHEEQLAKTRRTRLAQLQQEQAERAEAERQQAEAQAQSIPTDPEFAAWLEGRQRSGRARNTSPTAAPIYDLNATDSPDASADMDRDETAANETHDIEASSGGVAGAYRAPDEEVARLSQAERRARRAKQARREWWKDAHTTAPGGTHPISSANYGSETISEQRKARVRTHRILRRLALASVLVLVAGGFYYCTTSPRFNVQSVMVHGRDITPSRPVEKAQALLVGHNWVRARTSDAQKVLQSVPTVQRATVARSLTWPPQLSIQLYERQPFVRVGTGRNWWVVDRAGVPFRRMNDKAKADRALLPLTGPQLVPHEGKSLPGDVWRAALRMVNVLQGKGANDSASDGMETGDAKAEVPKAKDWDLKRIYFDRSGAVSVRLAGGPQDGLLVRLGNESWAHKLDLARQAVTFFSTTGRRAATLDLASPDLPSLVSLNRAVWTERAPEEKNSDAAETQSPTPTATRLD